ncbi:MAG: hypothetical protein UR25_C0004G0098 [Candidatus Nomurabacteria bacterium GW2011_GWE1_32_28]|uniref:DUF2779 domain-containing protein n=1 Tax=Candidatus Nomurabacteria bacterium GW2011_GWF1_31_48 TaxID=1618767 RepID=A0A0F9YFQ3_9BACT|nr:MAG: hypothetical protein UR10_C0004G0098 [Candidatus Nomurabacteria bacterium GW2011_GWF2_30_133]KKP28632.1 MAG: hypothetical protein UR18_C0002G0044 [Candidatus Nomurabacteria bacterium GW2011_GWE2_31_40]KKP30208.1 MAG: hypothetical protein UR19_C0003G0044 [Candidatus Nomurabacteria bacterium GW2011_GWF1_31_48]KKP34734.1 MAG: hypothetical protein UR25_C0004G0098 [Candidatus Nomurabacteria bacterium GW2011_GWE1_32_28]HAS80808.1 hypothetical protein [Candidatus Nomurabacteria bacterium]
MKLTKTDYLIYRDCEKNAWLKVHKPDIYFDKPLSAFDQSIIETGNEVDTLARELFPNGVLVSDRNETEETIKLLKSKTPVIYQPVFETDLYKTICDILVWNKDFNVYDLYEVKASNSGEDKSAKDKLYSYDIAFQYLVLKELNIPLGKLFVIRFNNQYVRGAELDIDQLFLKEDFTEKVMNVVDGVSLEMKTAYDLLSSNKEPFGSCKCITRGRSSHCTTFSYSNPQVPDYSVHDISRIGMSKSKLTELIDSNILLIEDVPEDFPLSEKQRNQVLATQLDKIFIKKEEIKSFLNTMVMPLSFLDYETFAAGVPRFVGFSPFNQITFQFSLHVLSDKNKEPEHSEFIFTKNENGDEEFISALIEKLPKSGSIIVWNKSFEMGRNKDLAKRNPEYKIALEDINSRMIDLMDIFSNQYFVHPKFKGKTSIKYILPILAPELSYKVLDIQEGASASDTWNKIVSDVYSKEEKLEKIQHLKTYCKLDTYAMYAIWKHLNELD